MKLRRFVGTTTTVALARVKEALGSDALILETRSIAGGVEVVAAVDGEPVPESGPAEVALAREVRELSTLVRTLVSRSWGEGLAAPGSELAELYAALAAHGVNGAIAASVIEETAARMQDGVELRGAVAAAVGRGLRFGGGEGAAQPERQGGPPRVRVLCGPPGDGKTTTIAKLAGRAMMQGGRRIALVSTDTYRVGGADELAAYARILDVPLATAASARELRDAVAGFRDVDEVLVDTAGVTTGDAEGRQHLQALGSATRGVRSTLVISATTSPAVTRRVWEALRELRPDSCIVTKVDEAPAVGAMETLWQQDLPLAFFGTGRRIPNDLEAASPERMASCLLAA
jgi:flagellar biosynthesis protein FlhF